MGNSRLNILSWACEPVTVIEVFRRHILAGVGSNLLIWRLGFENRHPEVVKVFTEGCPITSISCTSCSNSTSSDGDIHVRALVTSLYCYRELVFNSSIPGTSLGKLDRLYEANSGEIIAGRCLDASFVVYDLNNTALLHDTCEHTDENKVTIYQGYLPAPDSVTITGSTKSDVLFFVATSSSVSICKLSCGDGQHDNEIHSLYTFCQPKGVIFSVKFYPEFKLILTTSDDRSVSLWNCDFKEADVSQFRPWEWTSVTLHGTLEGHTSRIFNAMLVHDHVVSVGEDSSIVAWSLKDLTRHRVIGSHSGSTIWACAYDLGSGRIYTGGDNGGIYEWNISQSVHTYELTEYCELRPVWFSNSEDNPIRLKSKANLSQDYPRLVKSFDETSSVVTTDSGKIYILDKDSIRYCHELESWRGYITFSWYPGKEIYVAGTLHGAFSFNKLSRLGNESRDLQVGCNSTFYIPKPEKIISTHFITSQELLIATVSSLLMYEVSMNTHSNGTINVEPIPQASIKWAAKQKSNTNCATAWNNVVFVGLDNGKIKSYNRKTGEMLYEFKARHSKYGVGGIIVYEDHLVTGGRDSSLNFFYIEEDFGMKDFDGLEPVTHLKTVPIPFLWVGTLLIYRDDLIVCGYDSADFVIYSFRREQIIGRTHCGGAHRAWDFLMSEDGTGFFTHIRNRRVYKVCFHLDQCNTNCIKEGLHLEDINSVTEIYSASETATIVATGSEDGAVKISTFRLEDIGTQSDVPRLGFTKVKTHTVSNHTSAVRCVYYQELMSNKEGFLLSGGGKSELVLTKLYLDGCHLKKYCRLRLFGFEEEVDFRIMDIKSMLLPLTKDCATEVAPDKMILVGFIACSDGTLRIIRYNGRFTFSKIYQKGIGATHCLTTVEILRHEFPSELTIFCGTSNGEILAWGIDLGFEASSESFWTLKGIPAIRNYTLAATSITAMTVIPNIVNTIIVIGGDDGSLHRLYADDFLHGDVQNHLLQSSITNGGIMGLQYCVKQKSGRDCCAVTIHFVSNGKLYKCDTYFDNIRSVRIPIEDGKGITICRQLNYDDTICKPFIAFGKGISLFAL